jgi:hypothetical protein
MRTLWDILYRSGAEIVVGGHLHRYEQFAPQDTSGNASAFGMREFIVGTGGVGFQGSGSGSAPNLEVYNNTSFGVLRLTLRDGSYSWQFLSAAGGQLSASGSDTCHGAPGGTASQSDPNASSAILLMADLPSTLKRSAVIRRTLRHRDRALDRDGGSRSPRARFGGATGRSHPGRGPRRRRARHVTLRRGSGRLSE